VYVLLVPFSEEEQEHIEMANSTHKKSKNVFFMSYLPDSCTQPKERWPQIVPQ